MSRRLDALEVEAGLAAPACSSSSRPSTPGWRATVDGAEAPVRPRERPVPGACGSAPGGTASASPTGRGRPRSAPLSGSSAWPLALGLGLRCRARSERRLKARRRAAVASAPESPVTEAKRILIVDDEQSMREMLAILLKKEGLDVRTAGSRAEAADALRRGPVDLVLTDVKLPDGDGIEILRHVKAASPETAVVVMTAYGTTETAVAARKLGAEAYILKPFDVDELRIVVRDALANRRPARGELRLKREVGQATASTA